MNLIDILNDKKDISIISTKNFIADLLINSPLSEKDRVINENVDGEYLVLNKIDNKKGSIYIISKAVNNYLFDKEQLSTKNVYIDSKFVRDYSLCNGVIDLSGLSEKIIIF